MLIPISRVTGATIQAEDGEIGVAKDILFDDQYWTIRYLVVDTNKWLPASRKVILSPISLGKPDVANKALSVNLTREKIKNSPLLETHQPVSRNYETTLFSYYGYARYWSGSGLWGTFPHPEPLADGELIPDADDSNTPESQLRSVNEVINYTISAKDKSIGHIKDFILNTKSWSLEYYIVNTRNWWPGGKDVLISTSCIESINWLDKTVNVNLMSEDIKQGPDFDQDKLMKQNNFEELHCKFNTISNSL